MERAPQGSRDPHAEEVIQAVVGDVLHRNLKLEVINVILQDLSHCRPGEIDRVLVRNLIPRAA